MVVQGRRRHAHVGAGVPGHVQTLPEVTSTGVTHALLSGTLFRRPGRLSTRTGLTVAVDDIATQAVLLTFMF